MIKNASWIIPEFSCKDSCPKYKKEFSFEKGIKSAKLYVSAHGVYDAYLNGKRIGDYILAPGWTVYEKRLQYQTYDIKKMLSKENTIEITVAKGWFGLESSWFSKNSLSEEALSLIALIHIIYVDDTEEYIKTDESWEVSTSGLIYNDIYNGEIFDATKKLSFSPVLVKDFTKDVLIPQEGEIIKEQERIKASSLIKTPKGEIVIDFGQNITGYVEFSVTAKSGDRVKISHAEILDADGNFYTENYRKAKATIEYICKDGIQSHKPTHTFYGFRYIRIDEFPEEVCCDNFTAIVVHSEMKRTGYVSSGLPLLNKLFENIIWGQKGNFLDIPTDCPQRDERLGWTGDIRAFIKAAAYNYDVEKFMIKWLNDLKAEQLENGFIPWVIPSVISHENSSAAWGDAATICPWNLYLIYGNKEILKNQYNSMKLWINYITTITTKEFLWTGVGHFGDWLALDAPYGECKGSSDDDFIASAFYAYSTSLVIKAGKVLGEDVSYYEKLYSNIRKTFIENFNTYKTQTEHVLAIVFDLCDDKKAVGDSLNDLILKNGTRLSTGFVGTTYLLQALSVSGHTKTAYDLLLQTAFPSWLYSVRMGATTIWEHWDGINDEGRVWSANMNSFNHYAFGSVIDWVYEVSAGITAIEEYPGFEKVIVSPTPDIRLGYLDAKFESRHGLIRSFWIYQPDGKIRYEITVPTDAKIVIDEKSQEVKKGSYIFYSEN